MHAATSSSRPSAVHDALCSTLRYGLEDAEKHSHNWEKALVLRNVFDQILFAHGVLQPEDRTQWDEAFLYKQTIKDDYIDISRCSDDE